MIELSARNRVWEGAAPLLRSRDVDVTVATVRGKGVLHEELAGIGIQAMALECRTSRDYPGAIRRLTGHLHDARIEIVHSCEAIPASLGGLASALGKTRHIYHWQHSRAEGRQKLMSRFGAHFSNLVMACSESAARYASEVERVPANRIRVAHNGVVAPRSVRRDEIARLRERLEIPTDRPIVGAVSRLRPEKGLDALIRSIPVLEHALQERVAVVIAGTGPQEAELRTLAQSVAPESVMFVGHQEDVAPWFALANVVAMPSWREAFGFTAAEAMASGRPLVASAVGGLVEVVDDGRTGVLVPPADASALGAALAEILADPAKAKSMGESAYQRYLDSFTTESMVDRWMECYADVLRRPQARR